MMSFALALSLLAPTSAAWATPEPEEYAMMADLGPQQLGQFEADTEQAERDLLTGRYDSAFAHLNAARDHLLNVSLQIAEGQSLETWENVRDAEAKLLSGYADLGRLYHLTGQYEQAVSVLNTSLAVNPAQPDVRYQQLLSYVAMK
ncbi:MAG: hypothetical protein ACO1RX_21595 [Candidatus Sericytochromatia bacterium]